MHTYFVSYRTKNRRRMHIFGETIVVLQRPISELDDLRPIKEHIVQELKDRFVQTVWPDIHIVSLTHLHSRPCGAP